MPPKRNKKGRFKRRGSSNNNRRALKRKRPRARNGRPFYSYDRMETQLASRSRSVLLDTGSQKSAAGGFLMDEVSAVSDFSNLYDRYRINRVVLTMCWSNDTAVNNVSRVPAHIISANTSATATISTHNIESRANANAITCYFFRDMDDTVALTEEALRERQDVQKFSMKRGVEYKRTIIPAMRSVIWQAPPSIPGGNPTFALGRKYKTWIPFNIVGAGTEADGAKIPLYGYKVLFKHLPDAQDYNQGQVTITARYFFDCDTVS